MGLTKKQRLERRELLKAQEFEAQIQPMYHSAAKDTIKLTMLDIRELFDRPIKDYDDLRAQGLEEELQLRFITYRQRKGRERHAVNKEAGRILNVALAKWARTHPDTQARREAAKTETKTETKPKK